MSTVAAWRVATLGRPGDVLRREDIEPPAPGPGQVLVRVAACALGFPDVLMCQAAYQLKPDLPFTPGAEICGDVVAVGPGARLPAGVEIGSRVVAITTSLIGGLAELALVDQEMVFAAPEGLPAPEAAAFIGSYLTAWLGLVRRARLQSGETVLVSAAAGGTGSAAVQLAAALGARVIGIAGGQRKVAAVRGLGAAYVVDRETEDVVAAVQAIAGRAGVDVGFDPVGGATWGSMTRCVAQEGRLVVIGFAGGEIQSQALNHPLVKNYSILGVNSGAYVAGHPDVVAEGLADLAGLVAAGRLSPFVGELVPMSEAARALQDLADGHSVGRYVVDVAGG
jgi:NADPH:quinone reductase